MSIETRSLPWHDALWRQCHESYKSGRLGQALLFAGPAGVGKRYFAGRLAASLLCEARDEKTGASCGNCRGCHQFSAGTHPNLFWLEREFNSKTDKEKRDISMEQLREMMDRLAFSSHYGQARVVVINPADALNINGINAVLKTVEEPPENTYLVLISERPMALVATLRSRCQRLNFSVPEEGIAANWLEQEFDGIDARAALAASGGAPLAALADFESGAVAQRQAWRDALLAVAERRLEPVAAAAQIGKDDVPEWLRHFVRTLHQILRSLGALPAEPAIQGLAQRLSASHIESLLSEAIDSQRRLQFNANPQLLLESLMISWWHRSAPREIKR